MSLNYRFFTPISPLSPLSCLLNYPKYDLTSNKCLPYNPTMHVFYGNRSLQLTVQCWGIVCWRGKGKWEHVYGSLFKVTHRPMLYRFNGSIAIVYSPSHALTYSPSHLLTFSCSHLLMLSANLLLITLAMRVAKENGMVDKLRISCG